MVRRKRAEAGAFNFRNVVWLSLLGAAVYLGVMYVPVYAEKYEVRSMLQDVANKNWRDTDWDADRIKNVILARAREIGATTEITEGRPTTVGGLVLLADDVFVTRDDTAKTMTLQVKYTRYIKYPFLKKSTQMVFSPSWTVSTLPVNWKNK